MKLSDLQDRILETREQNGLDYVTDSTNFQPDITLRNALRAIISNNDKSVSQNDCSRSFALKLKFGQDSPLDLSTFPPGIQKKLEDVDLAISKHSETTHLLVNLKSSSETLRQAAKAIDLYAGDIENQGKQSFALQMQSLSDVLRLSFEPNHKDTPSLTPQHLPALDSFSPEHHRSTAPVCCGTTYTSLRLLPSLGIPTSPGSSVQICFEPVGLSNLESRPFPILRVLGTNTIHRRSRCIVDPCCCGCKAERNKLLRYRWENQETQNS